MARVKWVPGAWGHLAWRFVDVLTARPLTADEQRSVDQILGSGPALDAFRAQPVADQRHGLEAAAYVRSRMPDRPDLIQAALLHDVGKRHASLGPLGRVCASLAIRLHLPLTARMALYRDHGVTAAAELAGGPTAVVEFARHHHGRRPDTLPADEWEILVAADRPVVSLPWTRDGR